MENIDVSVRPNNTDTFFMQISSLSKTQQSLTSLQHQSTRARLLKHPFLVRQSDPLIKKLHRTILDSTGFQPTREQSNSPLPVRRTFDSIANHWLFATPCAAFHQTMPPHEYRAALALRMLLPIIPTSHQCTSCNNATMDVIIGSIIDNTNKQIKKYFSIAKLGDDEAQRQATEKRKELEITYGKIGD